MKHLVSSWIFRVVAPLLFSSFFHAVSGAISPFAYHSLKENHGLLLLAHP
jgi:hypothetical protein